MVKTTPPGRGSRLLTVGGTNPVYDALVREVARRPARGDRPVRRREDLGVACYHTKVGAVELLLNHLVDGPGEYVVVDMTAGADSFASGLFTRFDATFLVCEPTLRSVGVYRQYLGYARDYGVRVHVVGNKVDDASDVDFLRAHVGDDLLTWFGRSACVAGRGARRRAADRDALEPANRDGPATAIRAAADGCGEGLAPRTPGRPPSSTGATRPPGPTTSAGADLTDQIDPDFVLGDHRLLDPLSEKTMSLTFPPPCWRAPSRAPSTTPRSSTVCAPPCRTPGRSSPTSPPGADDAADFAEHAVPPPSEAERGQLLRALASDAIRGGLERHFGVKLAFQNCHRVAAFRPATVDGDAYREFVSPLAQIRNQSPELRDC